MVSTQLVTLALVTSITAPFSGSAISIGNELSSSSRSEWRRASTLCKRNSKGNENSSVKIAKFLLLINKLRFGRALNDVVLVSRSVDLQRNDVLFRHND